MSEETKQGYLSRALAAWYRSGEAKAPSQDSATIEHEGLHYVRLVSDAGDTMAVYRVTNQGTLKRMKRPPKAIA